MYSPWVSEIQYKMRRVYHKFAAFLDHAAEPVTGLSAEPKLLVMRIEQGDDPFGIFARYILYAPGG